MTKIEEAIAKAAFEMSRDARAELAHRLIAGLDDEQQISVDTAWIKEIRKRVAEIDAGELLLDGDEVMQQARLLVEP